jgi:hypothetical protein
MVKMELKPWSSFVFSSGCSERLTGWAHLKLVQRKQRLLKDAWLTSTGHKRPGMKRGLLLEEAQRWTQGLDAEINALLDRTP